MKENDVVTWALGGIALWIAWQWYQQYVATTAAATATTGALFVSPVPQEGPVVTVGTPMNSVIY